MAARSERGVALRFGDKVLWFHGECADRLRGYRLETLLRVRLVDGCPEVEGVIHEPVEERGVDYLVMPDDPAEFAREFRWFMRNPAIAATLRYQAALLRLLRREFDARGFTEVLAPMISIATDPGLRGARKLRTEYYGMTYELTSSVIMFKQASAAVLGKVYFVARNVREEPPAHAATGRHLSEFTQFDIEWALATVDDAMKLAEDVLKAVSKALADEGAELLEAVGKRKEPVVFEPPFERIPYDDALDMAKGMGYDVRWGKELSQEAETAIARKVGGPVWLTGFPVVSRGFYYLPNPEDPRYNLDFNLILPEGYGEVIDGGTREYRHPQVEERIRSLGEPVEIYEWFIDLTKKGAIPPSTGWGLGVERLTRYLLGWDHIARAAFFPKVPGVVPLP